MRSKRPATLWALIVLAAIQIVGATAGGIGLVQDPINNIGMPRSVLEGSPFSDFLIPGLILLLIVGLFPIIPLVGLVLHRKWGWWFELAAGGGLIIWIIAEVILLGYLPGAGIGLQIAMGLLGIVLVTLTLLPSTRRYFGIGKAEKAVGK
ncbi:MAG: hypothetical protein M1274_05515 [Actinobacteria bacterium]|nr:hypothetical protein [Actinomycetota bacterium]